MTSVNKSPAIFLMGPTAAGKTDLAIELVERLPCDIISVDSAMIYRGMDIGTAKPGADVLARAPHRLIDIRDPHESYSAAAFRKDALHEMKKITERGRIPLLVGGTMMYYKALYQGLSDLPSADEHVRQQIDQRAAEIGWQGVHAQLAAVDAESAARIHPNDPQRIQRALEVYELTGLPLSEHFRRQQHDDFPYDVVQIALAPVERHALHERIAQRFHQMLELGLVDEVKGLYGNGKLHLQLPSMRSVGYRQALKYLLGDLTYQEMVEKGIIATRQLGKRQMTWLRANPEAVWLDVVDPNLTSKALKILGNSGIA